MINMYYLQDEIVFITQWGRIPSIDGKSFAAWSFIGTIVWILQGSSTTKLIYRVECRYAWLSNNNARPFFDVPEEDIIWFAADPKVFAKIFKDEKWNAAYRHSFEENKKVEAIKDKPVEVDPTDELKNLNNNLAPQKLNPTNAQPWSDK